MGARMKNRQMRVRHKNVLLEKLIAEWLRRNPGLKFPDLGELALMTLFQANPLIQAQLQIDFVRLAPNMEFVKDLR